jgi:SH3 domain protein
MTKSLLALVLLAAPLLAAAADTAYVSDKLVVGVYATATTEGERIAQLATGDTVEVESREQDFTQVRLADGREGWIKNSYLSADPPAAGKIPALQAELQKLRAAADKGAQTSAPSPADAKRIAELQKALDAAKAELATRAKATPAAMPEAAPAATPATHTDDELAIEPIGADVAYRRKAWVWGSVVALLTFGVGFGIGWWVLDRRVRARYGGLRVY